MLLYTILTFLRQEHQNWYLLVSHRVTNSLYRISKPNLFLQAPTHIPYQYFLMKIFLEESGGPRLLECASFGIKNDGSFERRIDSRNHTLFLQISTRLLFRFIWYRYILKYSGKKKFHRDKPRLD
jgi:hypothetical protein